MRRALEKDKDSAFYEALADVNEVKRILAKEEHQSLAEKARIYILDKVEEFRADLEAHSKKDFDPDDDTRVFNDGENLYILSTIFDQWLKNGGFTHRRVLRDWKERGWIKTEQHGEKINLTILKRRGGDRNYYVVLTRKALNDEED